MRMGVGLERPLLANPPPGWEQVQLANAWRGICLSHIPKARVGMGTIGCPPSAYVYTLSRWFSLETQGP